ncbi:MAG: hypothetical protein ABJA93_13555 [Sporichthyaceae bacterium]
MRSPLMLPSADTVGAAVSDSGLVVEKRGERLRFSIPDGRGLRFSSGPLGDATLGSIRFAPGSDRFAAVDDSASSLYVGSLSGPARTVRIPAGEAEVMGWASPTTVVLDVHPRTKFVRERVYVVDVERNSYRQVSVNPNSTEENSSATLLLDRPTRDFPEPDWPGVDRRVVVLEAVAIGRSWSASGSSYGGFSVGAG